MLSEVGVEIINLYIFFRLEFIPLQRVVYILGGQQLIQAIKMALKFTNMLMLKFSRKWMFL